MIKKIATGILSTVILGLVAITAFIDHDFSVNEVAAQSCSVPTQVQNVEVQFPKCDGDVCDFTQARCVWDAVSGATAYNVTITQVESGSVVYNQSVGSSTLLVDTAIVQNNTYLCSVAAVNSCGAGTAGTHSLLCAADALVDETPAPTAPPVTSTPIPPTIAPTGGIGAVPAIAGAASLVISGAGAYFFFRR